MAQKLSLQAIADSAIIHAAPPAPIRNAPVDRTFELPTRLYAATAAMFLAYIGIMGAGFAHPEMAIPLAIFALFIVAGFGVPMLWTLLAPENPVRAMSWERFRRDGIMTAFGRTTASDATVQVLILPTLILAWGVAAVIIAALVR